MPHGEGRQDIERGIREEFARLGITPTDQMVNKAVDEAIKAFRDTVIADTFQPTEAEAVAGVCGTSVLEMSRDEDERRMKLIKKIEDLIDERVIDLERREKAEKEVGQLPGTDQMRKELAGLRELLKKHRPLTAERVLEKLEMEFPVGITILVLRLSPELRAKLLEAIRLMIREDISLDEALIRRGTSLDKMGLTRQTGSAISAVIGQINAGTTAAETLKAFGLVEEVPVAPAPPAPVPTPEEPPTAPSEMTDEQLETEIRQLELTASVDPQFAERFGARLDALKAERQRRKEAEVPPTPTEREVFMEKFNTILGEGGRAMSVNNVIAAVQVGRRGQQLVAKALADGVINATEARRLEGQLAALKNFRGSLTGVTAALAGLRTGTPPTTPTSAQEMFSRSLPPPL